MIACTNCGAELDENQKFCSECGTPVNQKLVCKNCGIELKTGAKFCPECGTAQLGNAVKKNSDNLSTLEKINFEKASKEFYMSTNYERLLELVKPIYEKHKDNEEILSLYLRILLDSDLEEVKNVLDKITVEYFDVYYCKISVYMKEKKFTEAEELLNEVEEKWPENKILKYLRSKLLIEIGAETENQECIADGLEILSNMENPELGREDSECKKCFLEIFDSSLYDYEFVLEYIEELSEKGNVTAQNFFGYMYDAGRGVEQDYDEAMKWYKKASDQGLARAQENLGYMYDAGRGVEQDYDEAMKWYKKAFDQGWVPSQEKLGEMYYFGKGVEKDYKVAMKYLKMAAEKGDSFGQFLLGEIYHYGRGVEEDDEEAVKWFLKSAGQGNELGQYCLGYMYEEGIGVEQDYDKAIELYKKSAAQGNEKAQMKLEQLGE